MPLDWRTCQIDVEQISSYRTLEIIHTLVDWSSWLFINILHSLHISVCCCMDFFLCFRFKLQLPLPVCHWYVNTWYCKYQEVYQSQDLKFIWFRESLKSPLIPDVHLHFKNRESAALNGKYVFMVWDMKVWYLQASWSWCSCTYCKCGSTEQQTSFILTADTQESSTDLQHTTAWLRQAVFLHDF